MFKRLLKSLAALVALLSFALSLTRFLRVRTPAATPLSLPKMLASALAPYIAIAGAVSAFVAAITGAPLATLLGGLSAYFSLGHVRRVLGARGDWEGAFGPEWQARISPAQAARFLQDRGDPDMDGLLEARLECDMPFWTIPADNRVLLCDIWQPPAGVEPTGQALIYLHGSGWHYLNKDVGTRPMFKHLANQGHVIMDVAYRLCPETDWRGMLGDAKRAVAWMKQNAGLYGVDPGKVVIMGGSAGGHLALLAAYTPDQPQFTPPDVQHPDLSVAGVVSWYGPADMAAYNLHAGLIFNTPVMEPKADGSGDFMAAAMNRLGFDIKPQLHWQPGQSVQSEMMRAVFGCSPGPDEYREASPIAYAGAHCPPTLLLQGEHDSIVPAHATRALAETLRAAGVPVVHVEFPETEHAFDLILPHLSPSAAAAMYDTERFLALVGMQ